ncbi:DNA-binding transcriptional response regulator, NtrC family, contains REC, AAA-type ATPase, and a Fis-type DNA-binding domains [Malonomonas rubra DSM 5091]|uniref:DNA-binding transcriptional response regulator, NtrC family, contains REC, AAA-type ATPase, and a Fis-type DNA-binding domains n=1 Tax=Malonomonas rubra DSM 5091 TaxID=1122189 RepID=A0A1M6IXA9_MALRU|nr:sigma-54 dependent transcriptional regulator [Malonomonas rubra]SHJ39052.1 DNA-binding transcriptional response regulator, NtrC family, contains REC, AAA-type ATPase, and a Fis-type DNA-binding domains [Malonomonas rubra DSM 5091]
MTDSKLPGRILVLDDDQALCELLVEDLSRRGHSLHSALRVEDARELLHKEEIDIVLTDLNMPGTSGIDFCAELQKNRPDLPVVIMTAFGSLETAIAALRAGAYDFVTKPVDLDLLSISLNRALQHRHLQEKVRLLKDQVRRQQPDDELLGESTALKQIKEQIIRIAGIDTSVLISGESGTGKELVARALHRQSNRSDGPFVAINCAALPESLLESELFGHVRGAFTDAREARKGLFVEASGGTLFLDEIGEMPLALQPKLLRVLEDHKVRPLGGAQEIDCDVRVVAASHRDLDEAVEQQRFRSDLYYRLNVINLHLPPLRERGNDILLLALAFVRQLSQQLGKSVTGLAQPAAACLLNYHWPGNVRELHNVIERALALSVHDLLTVEDLPEQVRHPAGDAPLPARLVEPGAILPLEEMERRYIHQVLDQLDGNRTLAAKALGVDRKTLYRKLKH